MHNEILLILSLIISFSSLLIFHRFFGKSGIYVWIALCAVLANIEVTVLVHAFGMDQTLGNMLFASKQGCLDRYFDDGFIYSVLIHVGTLYSGSERYIDALDKTIILQYSENSYGKPCSVYDFRAFRCPPLSRLVEFNGTNNRRKK